MVNLGSQLTFISHDDPTKILIESSKTSVTRLQSFWLQHCFSSSDLTTRYGGLSAERVIWQTVCRTRCQGKTWKSVSRTRGQGKKMKKILCLGHHQISLQIHRRYSLISTMKINPSEVLSNHPSNMEKYDFF
jgi:hypothetical protein